MLDLLNTPSAWLLIPPIIGTMALLFVWLVASGMQLVAGGGIKALRRVFLESGFDAPTWLYVASLVVAAYVNLWILGIAALIGYRELFQIVGPPQ